MVRVARRRVGAAETPLLQHVRLRRISSADPLTEAETGEARHITRLRGLLAPTVPDDDAAAEAHRLCAQRAGLSTGRPKKKAACLAEQGPIDTNLGDGRARSGLRTCHVASRSRTLEDRTLKKQ